MLTDLFSGMQGRIIMGPIIIMPNKPINKSQHVKEWEFSMGGLLDLLPELIV